MAEIQDKELTILELERRRQGLKIVDLGRRLGIDRAILSRVERKHTRPSSALKAKIAAALGMEVADLWPQWYVPTLDETLTHRGGGVLAFTSREAAEQASPPGYRVVGPVGPEHLAPFLDCVEADVPDRLNIDPEAPS